MALKLLIFVPAHTDAISMHHELTTRLSKSLAPKTDVYLATSEDKNVLSSVDTFDIVHIFGCWSHNACQIAAKAYKEHIPYIVTPLGGLQPWEMEHHTHSFLAQQQQKLIRQAAAVHVCGKLEENTFSKLGWNSKVCLIKNPMLTSQTTFELAAQNLLKLYRKVIDSNARLLLSEDVQKIIGHLLQIAIDPHASSLFNNEDYNIHDALMKMSDEDWRRMLIYADDEHIYDYLTKTLVSLGFESNVIDTHSIDRFERSRGYAEGHLRDDALLSRNLLLRNKVKDVFDENGKMEQKACTSLLNLYFEVTHHTAPLLHLADIYTVLRFTDMDEDALNEMTVRLKINDFAMLLMNCLDEFLGLTEGFMPFKEKKGRGSMRLLKSFTKFGTYI